MADRVALENVVRAIYSARDRGDIDALMEHVDAGCSFRLVGGPRLGPASEKVCGAEPVRCAVQSLIDTWDMSNVDIVDLNIDGDTVFAHRAGKIRFIPGEAEFESELADKFVFRDGRLVEFTEFLDTLQMAETVGLVKF